MKGPKISEYNKYILFPCVANPSHCLALSGPKIPWALADPGSLNSGWGLLKGFRYAGKNLIKCLMSILLQQCHLKPSTPLYENLWMHHIPLTGGHWPAYGCLQAIQFPRWGPGEGWWGWVWWGWDPIRVWTVQEVVGWTDPVHFRQPTISQRSSWEPRSLSKLWLVPVQMNLVVHSLKHFWMVKKYFQFSW